MQINEYPVREMIQDTDKFLLQTAAGATCGGEASSIFKKMKEGLNDEILEIKKGDYNWRGRIKASLENRPQYKILTIKIKDEMVYAGQPIVFHVTISDFVDYSLMFRFVSQADNDPLCNLFCCSPNPTDGKVRFKTIKKETNTWDIYLMFVGECSGHSASIHGLSYDDRYFEVSSPINDAYLDAEAGNTSSDSTRQYTSYYNDATTLGGSTKEEILEQTTKVYSGTANPTNDIGKTGDLYFKIST